ncbi:MAG: S-layer homology domain-containing protein [Actinomycetota bacterium]|nr:S-layer homology domain-containing protein [Actinomycetota bacterium]
MHKRKIKMALCIFVACLLCITSAIFSYAQTWSTPTNISQNSSSSRNPILAMGSSNDFIHMVWTDNISGNDEIYHRRFDGTTWSSPINISNTSGSSDEPSIAIDSSGNVHVVWMDYLVNNYEICYAKFNGASWSSPPQNISNTRAISCSPSIAVDAGGNIHVVWDESNDVYYTKFDGTSWGDRVKISTLHRPAEGAKPSIAADKYGNVHVVYRRDFLVQRDPPVYNYEICYTKFDGTSWSTPENISYTPTAEPSKEPAITTDRDGNVHVVWQKLVANYEIYYREFDGTSWGSISNLSKTSTPSYCPSIATDKDGNLHVVWHEETASTNREVYYKKSNGTSWSSVVNLSNNSGRSENPSIVVDAGANPHIVWQDSTSGNWDVYYNRLNVLDSPNGGEKWIGGSTHAVTWTISGGTAPYTIDLYYSTNGGLTYPNAIATDITQSSIGGGSFSWTLPSINSSTVRVKIKVTDADGDSWSDTSDANFTIDSTPPSTPVVTGDGDYTSSADRLHASWASSDPQSGVVEYQYAIGTSPGVTDVVPWTSVGSSTSVTRTGLNLERGKTYYFVVKAKNGVGLWSAPGVSDGIMIIFPDVPPGFWAFNEIMFMASQGIISGYADGLFRPANPVTRSQFTKMLVNSLRLPLNTEYQGYFTDVPPNHWGWQYIETAKDWGIVQGYGDGRFGPEDTATRAHLATMLVRGLGIARNTQYQGYFPDVPPNHWAWDYIETAKDQGIIKGYDDGLFRPEAWVRRDQTAVMVYRAKSVP